MADETVASTQKGQLASRNKEESHLKSDHGTDAGGVDANKTKMNTVVVDGTRNSPGKDTSIPAAVGPEATHLKAAPRDRGEGPGDELEDKGKMGVNEGIDVDFDGDDDGKKTDDLDEALDSFGEAIEIEVGKDKDDDKDDKKSDDKPNPFAKKDDDKKVEESKKLVKEEEIVIKDDDKDDKKSDDKKDDDKGGDDKKPNPFAKKNDKVEESVKVRIKLPQGNLFESAGLDAQGQKAAGVVFETVIKDISRQVTTQLHEHYKSIFEEKIAKRDAVMAKQMDAYLNYVVEEWVKSNKVAIRQSLRTQFAEEFMTGLHKLFKEHYVDVPDSKVDVVKELTEKVGGLEQKLNEQVRKTLEVRKLAEAANKARIVADFARKNKLSEASLTKFIKLAEDVAYTNAKDFREKLGMLKETYFAETLTEKKLTKALPEETVIAEEKKTTSTTSGDPDVDFIAETLSRQAKQVW